MFVHHTTYLLRPSAGPCCCCCCCAPTRPLLRCSTAPSCKSSNPGTCGLARSAAEPTARGCNNGRQLFYFPDTRRGRDDDVLRNPRNAYAYADWNRSRGRRSSGSTCGGNAGRLSGEEERASPRSAAESFVADAGCKCNSPSPCLSPGTGGRSCW